MSILDVKLDKFPTHLPYTNNKKVPDKFAKLNNQSIYNGRLARFGRSTLVRNMHRYIGKRLPKNIVITDYPIKVKFTFHTVINHGDISRRNENIIWKYPSDVYEPKWDIENLATIWIKAFMDCLVVHKIIVDDNIKYVNNIEYEFQPIEELDDRCIEISISNDKLS